LFIESRKEYPLQAKRLREVGRVVVSLVIARDGRFLEVTLVEPSSSQSLNEGSIQTMMRLEKFKPLPESLTGVDSILVKVPLVYSLK
jgi:TonB family protein